MKRNFDKSNKNIHILIVDDEPSILKLINNVLKKEGYQCFTASNGKEALQILDNIPMDLVIADIVMPEMNGIELLEKIKEKKYDTDVILMTGHASDFTYSMAITEGALDFIHKPIDITELILRIKRILRERRLMLERKVQEEELRDAYQRLNELFNAMRISLYGTIHVLASIAEKRDPYTAGHQKNVAQLAREIAEQMGLPDDKKEAIFISGMVHDVGKITIPSEILTKPGKLTEVEFELIKEHSKIGYDILKDIRFPWPVAEIVRQHHERMNGSGYPDGLKNEEIHMEARVIAVADVVEAMSSHRPYRPALGVEKALDELEEKKGVLYDPMVVDACIELLKGKDIDSISRQIYKRDERDNSMDILMKASI